MRHLEVVGTDGAFRGRLVRCRNGSMNNSRCWTKSGAHPRQFRSMFTDFAPKSTNHGPPKFCAGKIWSRLGNARPNLAHTWPELVEFGLSLVDPRLNTGPTLV